MECQNCELRQRQFYCTSCLKQHLLSYRLQSSHITAERDAQVKSAQRSLQTVVEPARGRRADLKSREEKVREIWEGLEAVRKANEFMRERLQNKRGNLAARRRVLAIASSPDLPSSSSSSSSSSPAPHSSYSPPQARSPFAHRRLSNTPPNQSTPTSSRPPSSARQLHPFPGTSTQIVRSASISPHVNRVSNAPMAASPPNNQSPFPKSTGQPTDDADKELARQIEEAQFQLTALSDTIARARSGLVQELVEVFSVVEVGGRPPLGGKAGTKGEWTIGGLVLSVPGDIRRYPPDHINAVLTHTLHFLSLLAFYLGIKLPFDWVWSRSSMPPSSSPPLNPRSSSGAGLLGVGTPWIGAIRGGENGGWARWSTKHPLHVSANPPPASVPNSPPVTHARPVVHTRSVSAPVRSRSNSIQSEMTPGMEDSHIEEPASTSASGSSFTTALAMLLYDVCYLAHTQGIDVSLAQAGEVLGNLWAVCCSPDLGRKSHATFPLLSAPTPPQFPLDFAQLLQATAANPSRARARGKPGKDLRSEREKDKIVEEDEGWDLVDDVSV